MVVSWSRFTVNPLVPAIGSHWPAYDIPDRPKPTTLLPDGGYRVARHWDILGQYVSFMSRYIPVDVVDRIRHGNRIMVLHYRHHRGDHCFHNSFDPAP